MLSAKSWALGVYCTVLHCTGPRASLGCLTWLDGKKGKLHCVGLVLEGVERGRWGLGDVM